MEKELNIAAILQDKPQNTRLWSPIFGDVYLKDVTDVNNNMIRITHHGVDNIFMNNGKVWADGDVCLFPSKQMQDWSKFAWKKGDVLGCGVSSLCIFEKWANEEYTKFKAKFATPNFSSVVLDTCSCHKVTDENTIMHHIAKIEKCLGGKLNLETLEIEKQHEFKDGDILYSNLVGNEVFIAKIEEKGILHSYVYMDIYNKVLNIDKDETFAMSGCIYNGNIRLATDSEKQQLFSALEKKGKRWDTENKQIVDLPKKCELKPFDKVLVRDSNDHKWKAGIFSHYGEGLNYPFICVGCGYGYCIPYNEETAHLLGTTDDWEGGEQ